MKHALLTLLLLFALALPASAQDETETPAPPTPTVEATAVVTEIPIPDDGDVIIVEPPSTSDTYDKILLWLGVITAGLMFLMDKTNRRANEAVPPSFLPILRVAVDALATLAQDTATTADDELIAKWKASLNPPSPPQP